MGLDRIGFADRMGMERKGLDGMGFHGMVRLVQERNGMYWIGQEWYSRSGSDWRGDDRFGKDWIGPDFKVSNNYLTS